MNNSSDNVLYDSSDIYFLEEDNIRKLKEIAANHPLKDQEYVCMNQVKALSMK